MLLITASLKSVTASSSWDSGATSARTGLFRGHRWRRGRFRYEDIIFPNRGEAEKVLDKMEELIDYYGLVSVADLYELVGLAGDYPDNKYGWTSIRSAEVMRVRNGYILKLPKAIVLD